MTCELSRPSFLILVMMSASWVSCAVIKNPKSNAEKVQNSFLILRGLKNKKVTMIFICSKSFAHSSPSPPQVMEPVVSSNIRGVREIVLLCCLRVHDKF